MHQCRVLINNDRFETQDVSTLHHARQSGWRRAERCFFTSKLFSKTIAPENKRGGRGIAWLGNGSSRTVAGHHQGRNTACGRRTSLQCLWTNNQTLVQGRDLNWFPLLIHHAERSGGSSGDMFGGVQNDSQGLCLAFFHSCFLSPPSLHLLIHFEAILLGLFLEHFLNTRWYLLPALRNDSIHFLKGKLAIGGLAVSSLGFGLILYSNALHILKGDGFVQGSKRGGRWIRGMGSNYAVTFQSVKDVISTESRRESTIC
mmetsp:Transcript_16263/g.38361  ORF Transcript_16263/g.38361 Transcript_16263/m.38361 type:complete len:258 (+) Transcript_16263:152-925(+)